MTCTPVTYNNVNANVWACLQAAFQKNGIDVTSADSGSTSVPSSGGATLAWDYAPATLVLTLTFTEGAVGIPCPQLIATLTTIVNESKCFKATGKCPSFIIRPVDVTQWDCLQKAFQSNGIDVKGTSGSAAVTAYPPNEVFMTWNYEPPWIRGSGAVSIQGEINSDALSCAEFEAYIKNIITTSGCL